MHIELINTESENNFDIQDLICPICTVIPDDPYLSSCCRRVFCKKDANRDQYDNGCPFCRQTEYRFEPAPEYKKLLDKYTKICECSERVFPDDMEAHRERCSKLTFVCPHTVCREKNENRKFNSQELVNHLARAHCDEVPVLGSTFVNKSSLEPYKKAAVKYEELVSALYSSLYPNMVRIQKETDEKSTEHSSYFKCPEGHSLIEAEASQRKRKNGNVYSSLGFNCDVCHRTFSSGISWHCSCSSSGFDKCVSCLVFELYNIHDESLIQASKDNEDHQRRCRSRSNRNTTHLPPGFLQLLSYGFDRNSLNVDDDDDDNEVYAQLGWNSLDPDSSDDAREINMRED